ncbi:Uncharacterized protein TCAP_07366 [Tolypocladium capitatum]|uniref:Uncharacterized protein n=1 Tax=Tolypocladium capitatum TaxID=45235 RepID=A0A2K3PZ46_9HYPO|nr:Uncharacterized protein TCAP_07366 [Tolypocladium capitatum]
MKLLSILLGLALARVGLAAPAAGPWEVITTEDGIPLMRTRVIRVDVADADTPSSPYFLSTKLSKYASDALVLLRLSGRRFGLFPVFALDADRSMAMADPNGDLVTMSYDGRREGTAWRQPAKASHPCSMRSLRNWLLLSILAVSLSVVAACSFLRRSVCRRAFEPAFESALAEKGIRPRGTERSQSTVEKKPASTAESTMDCL